MSRTAYMMLLILVLVVVWIFYYKSIEPFEEEDTAKQFFNPINNMLDPSNLPPVPPAKIAAATQGVQTENQEYIAGAYDQGAEPGEPVQVGDVYEPGPDLTTAQTVCEPVTVADCSAFKNPKFNANCGISFDLKGSDSKGQRRIGGLFIKPSEKASKPSNGIYNPTYGRSRQFAINEATCEFMKNDIACKTKQNPIGTKNCSSCFSDGTRHAVEPSTTKVKPTFVFYTNALTAALWVGNTPYILATNNTNEKISAGVTQGTAVTVNGMSYKQIILPSVSVKEGDLIYVSCWSNQQPVGIAGYIQAATQTGTYSIDLNAVVDGQINFRNGAKWIDPNIGGDVNSYMLFIPFDGDRVVILKGMMPFTFMGPATSDAFNCSNGPFITTDKAMAYMSTNEPCYDPETGPGTYKLACLQQLFLSSGGTQAGKGYPKDEQTSRPLLYDNTGSARTLAQIGQFLYAQSTLAATGLQNGQSVNIATWNSASVFMTNTAIANPCQTRKQGQPLSNECMSYLYSKSGCGSKGAYNPTKGNPMSADLAAAKARGDQDAVSRFYQNALNTVNTSSIPRAKREPAFLGCFGIDLL